MWINSLTLVGYKRMRLNEVKRFSMTMTNPIQLILGTNGSGKSSLMEELTPLPPNSGDYFKDGSKTITIEDGGNSYIMHSVFEPKAMHSFKKNGVELNPGGTANAQRQLVKQEFQITPEIHLLMIGRKRFSYMEPSERRVWMTRLSDVSYDYALAVFSALKTRHRDTSGALKRAKNRLVEETTKLVSAEELNKLRLDVDILHSELTLLLENRAPVVKPVTQCESELQSGINELTGMSNRLLRIKFEAPYGINPLHEQERDDWGRLCPVHFNSIEEIDTVLNQLKEAIIVKETLISKNVTDHGKLKETLAILVKTGEEGVGALKQRLVHLREERDAILAKRSLKIEGLNPSTAKAALDSVKDLMCHVFESIPLNDNRQFSGAGLKLLEEKLLETKQKKLNIEGELNRVNATKIHQESHKRNATSTCPKCHHRWIEGYSEGEYDKLLVHIETKNSELKETQELIKRIELDIDGIRQYSSQYRDYSNCLNNWKVLQPFWNYLTEKQFITHAPKSGSAAIMRFDVDLHLELDAQAVSDKITEVLGLIQSSEQVGDANLAEVKTKMDETDLAVEIQTMELSKLQKAVKEYHYYRSQLLEAIDLQKRIENQLSHVENLNNEMVEMTRRDTLNHCIRQLQFSLSTKEELLRSIELQNGIFKDLEKQIDVLTLEEVSAKLLVNELSPTDGLIAEGIMGFINSMTKRMNSLIKTIWSYPLEIRPCKTSGDGSADLDYQFPMLVQTSDNIVDDVSCGSTGMREVVDLSFKIVAMQCLGLADAALFLDEFGATMDVAHRIAASNAIKVLIDHHAFSQLFMISHYDSSYSAMTNAEVCVLCNNNVIVPVASKYNQHVTIE